MTRSRRPLAPVDPDTPLHEPWRIPGYQPEDPQSVEAALAGLADVLNRLTGPLEAAITELTPQQVAALMRRTPIDDRARALTNLGVAHVAPRTVAQALCRDMCARLQRVHLWDARNAIHDLTMLLAHQSIQQALTDRDQQDVAEYQPQEWPANIYRLAFWANLLAGVGDARWIVWATRQPWWSTAGLTDQQEHDLLQAAQAVIDASTDFDHRCPPGAGRNALADADGIGQEEARADEDADGNTAEDRGPTAGRDAADPLAEVDRLREQIASIQPVAAAAAERLVTDVRSGTRPDPADLRAVQALADSIDELAALLPDPDVLPQIVRPERLSMGWLEDALAQWANSVTAGRTAARLAVLDQLTVVGTSSGLTDQLRALHDLTDAAVGADPDDPRLVALLALAGLAEDIRDIGRPDTDPRRVLEVQEIVAAGLPSEGAVILVSLLTGQLVPARSEAATSAATADSPDDHSTGDGDGQTEPESPEPTAYTDRTGGIDNTDNSLDADDPVDTDGGTNVSDRAYDTDIANSSGPERAAAAAARGTDPAPERPADTEQAPATKTNHQQDDDRPTRADSEPAAAAPAPPVTGTVSALVGEQRYGLAAAIAQQAGWSAARTAALRIAALADAVRGEAGPSAARLRAELARVDETTLSAETATVLLATPALLRVALITGEATPGALLTALAPRLEPSLAQIAEQVGRRALQGILANNPLRTVLADVTELETGVVTAREAAQQWMRPRTLRFKRATDIARLWTARDGLLGQLLTAAAADNRRQLGAVTAAVVKLSDHASLGKEIDILDRRFKGSSGKPIEGAARQNLLALAADGLACVSAWLEAVAAVEQATSPAAGWTITDLAEMRAEVLAHAGPCLAALTEQTARDDALASAAAVAADQSLTATFALLDGTGALPAGEALPDVVLTSELLKLPGAVVDATSGLVTPPPDADVVALIEAAALTWPAAFNAKVDAEEYSAAGYLLAMARSGLIPADGGLDAAADRTVKTATVRSRTELTGRRDQLTTDLRRARLQNEITEEQDGELTGLLKDADPARPDLNVVRGLLETVAGQLPTYRLEAAHRLKERLRALADQQTSAAVEVDIAHIQRLIDEGDLSTAEEMIYFLEIGEPVPSLTQRADLARFFPAVPDAMPAGITTAVVAAARTGQMVSDCPVLDFSGLSADAATEVADALETWRATGSTPVETRAQLSIRSVLLPALKLAGLEFQTRTRATQLNVPKGRERQFYELSEVSWNGRPPVPEFASKLGGRLRVMVCWGRPAEDLLMSWVDQDTSGDAILVVYFGTMPAASRRRLAARAVRTYAPVIVLDDAALAYLAANGDRQMDAALAVLLPFAAVQPYARNKRSLVAPEMFYGREAERKEVLSPEGTQVIFGGRGLGKSALLRSAKAAFEREPERVAIHIELTTTEIGPGKQAADAVWDVLVRDLETAGVITLTKADRRSGVSHDIIRAGVLDWLGRDRRRRLLILLDESDGFFEADAPRFLETNRLKDLGQLSGVEGRAKVVFAGLHSVQRFAKMSNNTFKHLAQRPTVIGPLPPQFAADLIARPMAALGYLFADPDLVNRILGYCSYQPFLLQMFGHRLVEHMQSRRAAGVTHDQPPFTVARADVEEVESDPDLRADITSTFSDTLNLDQRYNVIANVLAWHAHEQGLDDRLSDVQLREECRSWWPDGFSGLDAEAFRAYLHEMVGLGVLAPNNAGAGWHLRSPNVLRMIGSKDQVMAELDTAESAPVPSEFIALETRRELPDGSRAPLTARQIDDLLGDHVNQVRLVLGSDATGVGKVADTLRAVCDDLAGRYQLVGARGQRTFKAELLAGSPGRRRVLLSDLLAAGPKNDACLSAVDDALAHRPDKSGVTRSVVIVSGAGQVGFWQQVLADPDRHGLEVVSLRRFDRRTLRVWSLDTRQFATDERAARLLTVTSGWPLLVEQAVERAAARGSEDIALDQLERQLASPEGAAAFVDQVGLTGDGILAGAFDGITSLVDTGASLADLITAAEMSGHPQPAAAVAALDALGVFDLGADGVYRVDPLLVRCWPFRRSDLDIRLG